MGPGSFVKEVKRSPHMTIDAVLSVSCPLTWKMLGLMFGALWWSLSVCFISLTRSHRGTARSAAIAATTVAATAAAAAVATVSPLGTAAHSNAPAAPLTRESQTPRARGPAGGAGYRPPLLAVTHESYDYVSSTLFVSELIRTWVQCVLGGGQGLTVALRHQWGSLLSLIYLFFVCFWKHTKKFLMSQCHRKSLVFVHLSLIFK